MADESQFHSKPKTRWWSSSRDIWLLFALFWANMAIVILLKAPDPVALILSIITASAAFYQSWGHSAITNRYERRLFWLIATFILLLFNYGAWHWT